MTAPVPLRELEPALVAALADGPQPLWRLAEAVGYADPPDAGIVEAALRSLKRRGLVRTEAGSDGVWAWSTTVKGDGGGG